ncbi:sialidase family protein [Undibacterium sp. SXout7W]|uniref:sialidase family protein n=1 Tax=Undibacterium sp. SXout7W TaxID=3413049 RepID=UPI003BF27D75
MKLALRFLLSSVFAISILLPAISHAQMNHGKAKAAKAELGTSAAFDLQGKLWIASKESAGEGNTGYVVLQSSTDMGKTWSQPLRVQSQAEAISADGENRPKLAFGPKGEIYIAYTKPLAKPYTGEIRFVRSLDGGASFSTPVTVHTNREEITHRFESMIVDRSGRIFIAWIDKRDGEAAKARKEKYTGAAIYYSVSTDQGASFKADYKLAEHSCECCRIAMALRPDGKPVAMWRHVFEPNFRDHALSELNSDGSQAALMRTSFDEWRIDACPHHGPSIAFDNEGRRHQTWFNVKADEGGVFYAATNAQGELGKPLKLGNAQAEHADVVVHGKTIALAWKQFDGNASTILGKISLNEGSTWEDLRIAETQGNSDQPHLLSTPKGPALVWCTQNEGVRIIPLTGTK